MTQALTSLGRVQWCIDAIRGASDESDPGGRKGAGSGIETVDSAGREARLSGAQSGTTLRTLPVNTPVLTVTTATTMILRNQS